MLHGLTCSKRQRCPHAIQFGAEDRVCNICIGDPSCDRDHGVPHSETALVPGASICFHLLSFEFCTST